MGVPKFFRWISERYPLVNQKIINQNDFDCFYLDMNGIVHSCFQKFSSPYREKNIFQEIFFYTEYLFRIVKPKKLIFMAFDGVSPRAKMNQQRSRRFRTKETNMKQNKNFTHSNEEVFDSNCITPGTEFMKRLSFFFKKWLKNKVKFDSEWKQGCDVIFSSSEVPGEGEHKIMNYIRKIQKVYFQYKKSTLKHCLYGLDADLIMLGLLSHEKNFTLLREKIFHRGTTTFNKETCLDKNLNLLMSEEFHLLEISLLRDMIFLEFKPKKTILFKYDVERIIDDFIFMCMLLGNDFIPGLPHLNITQGGLNLLVRSYKEIQQKLDGYLTKKHQIHFGRAELFFRKISSEAESLFFFRRKQEKTGNETYKSSYYLSKFKFTYQIEHGFLSNLIKNYIHGLHWCLFYYHKKCPSWNWFYPEYYSPLCSDLVNLCPFEIFFTKGRPFSPLIQLLAVLPPRSSVFLPSSFANLMLNEKSPVKCFYPYEYKIDLNGKKNVWEGIVLLPFIDENKLLDAIKMFIKKEQLSIQEKERNSFARDIVFTKIAWK
ncbi:dhm exonuclease (nucleomorph) [Cryptomonas paramecium]|uniref:Dhm exonuclease n=1 Tax=Cryptomonas paramaecium TaxID=2898 RepID=F2HIE7_9CRYP|nr:dhm exonuclease [Cryptomonas paramecium]AEA39071.1 dhm exonuclease [Cryptomonas paramecium]|mmetsp:Transcript_16869/g.46120  ORF Transcript_16869/g.46120 Transcript_16869/m.46120 type:complete len:542 (+) Transcript_16869:4786-6411(+)